MDPELSEDLEWQLFKLLWREEVIQETRTVAVFRSDGQPVPFNLASQLVEHCWKTIARYCRNEGYAYANLHAEGDSKPIIFRVPAEFADSPANVQQQNTHPWTIFPNPCPITAIRFIPFFLGSNIHLQALEVGQYGGVPCYRLGNLHIVYSWDGFAVGIVEQESIYENVPQFLWDRRRSHQAILHPESTITQQLLAFQDKSVQHPIIKELPMTLSYVMSIHKLNNPLNSSTDRIPEATLRLIAEPSILGISDAPNHDIDPAYRHLNFETLRDAAVAIQRANGANIYSTWANVLLEAVSDSSSSLRILIQQEIQLQRLWYKLFLLSENLMGLSTIDEAAILLIRRTQQEFLAFTRTNPTASTLENGLTENLVDTSKIRGIYQTFVDQVALINDTRKSPVYSRPSIEESDL